MSLRTLLLPLSRRSLTITTTRWLTQDRKDKQMPVGQKRLSVFTVPNVLTMSRVATAPFMGYFIWNGMHYPALACFAYAATTDLLDGFLARRLKQESDFGAILDPVADKLLLTTSFVALFNAGILPLWATKAFVGRDVILLASGITIRYLGTDEKWTLKKFVDIKNTPTIGFEPTYLSKCNTALQCLVVLTHLSTHQMAGIASYDWAIFGLHALTVTTTMGSLSQYIMRYIQGDLMTKIPRSKG